MTRRAMNANMARAAFLRAALAVLSAALLTFCFGCGKRSPVSEASATPVPLYGSAQPTAALPVPPSEAPAESPSPAPTEDPKEHAIAELMVSMTVEEKIGQLLLFGFSGTEIPASFCELIDKYPVGNVIFFGDNVDKTDGSGGFDSAARLTKALETEKSSGIPRLFAIDVEGGSVVRFDWEPAIPSPSKLSRLSPGEVRGVFRGAAEKLRSCGITLDLAPVCDIAEDPSASVMGTRIFSSDLETSISCAGAVIDGLHDGGCASCAKHFPGHGSASADSHSDTPVVGKSAEELYSYDLEAFRGAVAAGADCVMTAHILVPALDEINIATLSPDIITGVLRNELGFGGVIISDDMRMQGLALVSSAGEAAVRFILAGGDMVLCGAGQAEQEDVILSLAAAVSEGTISLSRLDESVSRVLALKLEYGLISY